MRTQLAPSLLAIAAMLAPATAIAQEAADGESEENRVSQSRQDDQLEEIVVTAQRREVGLQRAPVAVSALSGETIEEDRILSFEDVAKRTTSLSFTAISGLDQEFNIRGITNTRLDSPSADQSIGIFTNDVYVGRPGLFNFDLYDIERVEVVRGPQGVLLGRNVVGGAINVIAASPQFTTGGSFSASYGNYDDFLLRGHLTGALSDSVAARLSFQTHSNTGYSQDILNDRNLDDIQSIQGRGQLLFRPASSDFEARLIVDVVHDESNGIAQIAIDGPDAGRGPWSAAREEIGRLRGQPLTIREALPQHPIFKGDSSPTPQGLTRDAVSVNAQMSKGLGDVADLQLVIGYRNGKADSQYDQTGVGPANGFGVISPLLFTTPVGESEDATQFSQELRFVSQPNDSGFEWIVGGYHQRDEVLKIDRFWGEVPLAALDLISGESLWNNEAISESWALFGQIGYQFSPMFKAVAGLRYSHDEKTGTVTATAVETGDRFNPDGTVPLTPLGPGLAEGQSFTTSYSDSWGKLTPQFTLQFTPSERILIYATYATGYKGGGFEDTPANAIAAGISYDPETVNNYELGAKLEFLNRRARINLALFQMDYNDLQVTQTDSNCLCSVTDNAADASIRGLELEGQLIPVNGLELFGSVTVLDTEYLEFTDSLGNDNTGNFLQRTPKYQFNVGFQYAVPVGVSDELKFRANYTRKGKTFWFPTNAQFEEPYGLLDARLSYTFDDRWTAAIWARNLTDEEYRVNVNYALKDEVSRFGAPRTYGAEIAFRF